MSNIQYAVFSLGEEEYGIEITFVQEIIRIPQQVKQLPNTPPFIEGITNLRNKIVPLINLKKRFDLGQSVRGEDSRLLVLVMEGMLLGIIVDDVAEVLRIDEQSIETLAAGISGLGCSSIKGIAKLDHRMILLLDALKLKDEIK